MEDIAVASRQESSRLLEEILIEGEGITAHIRKIGLNGPLARQAGR